MKTYLDCIPCFFTQALFAARLVLNDEKKIKQVLDRIGMILPEILPDDSPPETARKVYSIVREFSGIEDPFKALKTRSINHALELYPSLKTMVRQARDPLKMAVKVAIAGNIIDFGANPDFEMQRDVRAALDADLAVNHYSVFAKKVASAKSVLYLGDNAGETVFDKILIETMAKSVVYAVRSAPIINDATLEDAQRSKLDDVADLLSSGCDAPGFLLNRCSKEFVEHFKNADVIISKGQGNWECLSNERRPIFYLLKAKCPVISRELDVAIDDTIIKYALYDE
jgi:uncharacterized protein with ATP-grasp and redox domains